MVQSVGHVSKINIAKMRMLLWMCGKTLRDNEMIELASIKDKMRENRLSLFDHL